MTPRDAKVCQRPENRPNPAAALGGTLASGSASCPAGPSPGRPFNVWYQARGQWLLPTQSGHFTDTGPTLLVMDCLQIPIMKFEILGSTNDDLLYESSLGNGEVLMKGLAAVQVLIVDDNHHLREMAAAVLKAAGVKQVHHAADGRTGLKALRSLPIDIVIVDFSMGLIDGLEFTRRVRTSPQSTNPYLPIIMMTGHSALHQVHHARDAGVTEFVSKPFSPKTLLGRVNAVICNPRCFIKSDGFCGPDRRRSGRRAFDGPERRTVDHTEGELTGESSIADGVSLAI